MFVVDFLVGAFNVVKNFFFGSSSSGGTGIETEMFGAWFSLGIFAVIIYLFISLASKPFQQKDGEE